MKSFKISFRLGVNKEIFDSIHQNSLKMKMILITLFYVYHLLLEKEKLSNWQSNMISLNELIHFDGNISVNPDEWFGYITFTGFVVRKKSRRETKGFLTEKYSIVGNTQELVIHLDPIEKFDGSEIEMDDGPIPQKNALYQLIQSNPPKIMIKEDAPEFVIKMLRHKGSGDRRALIRDTLFAPILVDVWEQLARAGIYKMLPKKIMEEKLFLQIFSQNHIKYCE